LLRSIVEDGKWFTPVQFDEFKAMKKSEKKKLREAKSAIEKTKLANENQKRIEEQASTQLKVQETIKDEFKKRIQGRKFVFAEESQIIASIKKVVVRDKIYKAWFSRIDILNINDGIVLVAENNLAFDFINKNYIEAMQNSFDMSISCITIEQYLEDIEGLDIANIF
jgi:hypothetical protein